MQRPKKQNSLVILGLRITMVVVVVDYAVVMARSLALSITNKKLATAHSN